MTQAVISVLGEDRPGIIAAVSQALLDAGCNIRSVSQTLLQAVFGALFVVAMPEEVDEAALAHTLTTALDGLDLDVIVHAYPAGAAASRPHAEPFVVTTHGPDRPGIVAAVSGVLSRHGVNVTDLQAVFEGGDRPEDRIVFLFEQATGRRPDDVEMDLLRSSFEDLLASYAGADDEARSLLEVGDSPTDTKLTPEELAAYCALASMILNLDEVITKG